MSNEDITRKDLLESITYYSDYLGSRIDFDAIEDMDNNKLETYHRSLVAKTQKVKIKRRLTFLRTLSSQRRKIARSKGV